MQDGNEEDELKKEAVSPKKGKKAKGQVDQPMVDEETKQQEGVEGEEDSQGANNEGSDAGSAGGEKDDL